MELKKYLNENWDKSKFIQISLNKSIKTEIENQTEFLNKYYDNIPLRTRAYVIVNSITEETIPKCKCGCGTVCGIDKTYTENGFRLYANSTCSRKDKTIDKNAKLKLEDYNWIYDQRVVNKKSIEDIANQLNISTIPVVKYLKYHKLNNLIDARRRNSLSISILSDKEKLQEIYESGLTCEQIAEKFGTTKSTVSRWLNIYNIKTRESNSYERKIKRVSKEENNLFEYVKSIYDAEIYQSNRSVLNGKELDIFIPKKNLAIEYNGLYSHQFRPTEAKESLIKGKSYHLQKTLSCEKQGIQLLHFYSDEWNLKNDIVKSIIASKLGLNEKVYARKCDKIILSIQEKNKFLNDNHIQGEDKSKIKIGLTYNNELVCVMTFCKSRFNSTYEWELSRFANKKGINVIGGFSRLLKWFREQYKGNIVSYADRRYSNGNVYIKNGFEVVRTNSPSYYYVDKNFLKRYNRMKFQKKLIGAYNCTEYEKAREMGYNKIFDCGTICFGLQ
jgi:transcriptional regulator with XRE-family HTH domain